MKAHLNLRVSTLAGIFLVVAFAVLYLVTLDDGLRPADLEGGDLITHQYAQVQGRFSNAPGYPLYTMGGWLWFHAGRLILGRGHNPIQILSSYSTLWALLALWLLYRLILEATARRASLPPMPLAGTVPGPGGTHLSPKSSGQEQAGGNWPVATLVTAFYGVTYFFWYYAVTTEQYTSAVAWTLAVVLLAFRWERTRRDGYLLGLALLMGVGLAHMLTLLVVALALLWFVLRTEPRLLRRPRLIAGVLAMVALPLLSYIFVYVRGAQHPEWRGAGQWTSTWPWFLSFLSTGQGRDELTWSLWPFITQEFPSLIWREMTWPGLIAGLLGIAALGRRRATMLYATLAIYLAFCWIDRQGNWFQVIMPAYALLAVGIGAGADWVWRRSRGAGEQGSKGDNDLLRSSAPALPVLFAAALLALIAYRGATSYPRADSSQRGDDTGLQPGWAILADDPPAGTAVLGTLQETLALNYLTEIWGQRPDLRSVTTDQARELLSQGASLAVTEAALPLVPQEVSPEAHYSALGRTLVALSATPRQSLSESGAAALGSALQPWIHTFGNDIKLQAGRIGTDTTTGETVVLLVWQALADPTEDWSVSVRLTQGGREIAQFDQEYPVHGAYPMSRWSPGEMVADAYPFKLPPDIAPDGVTVILYRKLADGSFANLDVAKFALQ
jgi:hypothetical protein